MAKKSKRVNKSLAVREYLQKNPQAMPKQIFDDLTASGITGLTTGYVSTIKTKFTKSGGKQPGRRGRPPGKSSGAKRGRPAKTQLSGLSLDSLKKAKSLVRELGSLQNARAALDALDEILN